MLLYQFTWKGHAVKSIYQEENCCYNNLPRRDMLLYQIIDQFIKSDMLSNQQFDQFIWKGLLNRLNDYLLGREFTC